MELVTAILGKLNARIEAVKAMTIHRDKREPGWERKEKADAKLRRIVQSHFDRQLQKVTNGLSMTGRKVMDIPINFDDLEFDDEFEIDLKLMILDAAKDGIDLFAERSLVGINYTSVNTEAAKWARKYAGQLIKEIDKTTLDSIRQIVKTFVETPGMTIGDVVKQLPFDERRAWTIATTEITRSYAQANKLAGIEIQKEFPDVRVVKMWFTNNDDRVCDICAPLDGMEIDIDAGFTTEEGSIEGLDAPPAHVNCRCWMDTNTKI
jgi:hypothetical protein